MSLLKKFPPPKVIPILDQDFYPASLFHKIYNEQYNIFSNTNNNKVLIKIKLEREAGCTSYYQCYINDNPELTNINKFYIERIIKFLLWQRGGWHISIASPLSIFQHIKQVYDLNGKRAFDVKFMKKIYERPFIIEHCDYSEIKKTNEATESIKIDSNGFRIGFDLGASDIKVCAILDGQLLMSDEIIWNPKDNSNLNYHKTHIKNAIIKAMKYRGDTILKAIGGSSAGIIINNKPMVSNLFRTVREEFQDQIKNIFIDIAHEYNVPIVVKNDGDIAALAAARILNKNNVLAIALGSSEAAGYINSNLRFNKNWLNELAFAPIDYSANAVLEEWSLDKGCGASYLSQQCIFRLAKKYNFMAPDNLMDAQKLEFYQNELERGDQLTLDLWQSMGCYLGYAIAHYANFYNISDVVIFGRCVSFKGGEILKQVSEDVLATEFKNYISKSINVHLPDERFRRIGQAQTAANISII